MEEYLSNSSDTVHLLNLYFALEDDVSQLLEIFEVDLLYSSVAVLSLMVGLEVKIFVEILENFEEEL